MYILNRQTGRQANTFAKEVIHVTRIQYYILNITTVFMVPIRVFNSISYQTHNNCKTIFSLIVDSAFVFVTNNDLDNN